MAINVSALTAYVEEQRLPLIRKTIFAAPSVKYFNLQTGVKHAAALNILNTTVAFGDGASCGWDEAGTSAFSQRTLEVGNYKVNMSFCDKAMLKYWNGYDVRVAAGQKSLPFEEEFINGVIDKVKQAIEKNIWQGVKATDRMDGILTILNSESSAIKVDAEAGATVYEKVLAAYENIPADILDKASIFIGVDDFRDLCVELTAKNLYHYVSELDEKLEIILPGTSTRVLAVSGLNGTHTIVAADGDNIYYGVDMEGDEEKFDLWYSQDNQEFRLAINFNAGVQVAFPDEIVLVQDASSDSE
jgi:hypothetical protein